METMRVLSVAVLWLATAPLAAETVVAPRSSFTVHGTNPDRAASIAAHAEQVRQQARVALLESTAADPWSVRCAIHVHATTASFAAAVGGPPAAARGATSLEFGHDGVTLRRIDVMGDGSDAVPDALAHEIVHVVLADRFTEAAPPRWADEGLAVLFDPPAKQREHDADFRAAQRLRRAWPCADLMRLEDYPAETGRQRVFYGQSAALVRWLVERRDAATFVRFASDCTTIGTEGALDRHYGLTPGDLEAALKDGPALEPGTTSVGMTTRGRTSGE